MRKQNCFVTRKYFKNLSVDLGHIMSRICKHAFEFILNDNIQATQTLLCTSKRLNIPTNYTEL